MAQKKKQNKNKIKLSTRGSFILTLVVVVLGYIGIQMPNEVMNLFDWQSHSQTEAPKTSPSKGSQSGDNPGPIEHGSAQFSNKELKDSKKGWITYGDYDKYGRPTQANALIKPDMINTGTSARQEIKPPGFISGLDPHNHSRGHLIGRQMGGSGDDPKNLVTLYQNPVNTPFMTKYENMVRKAADNGETIRYQVTPVYDKDEPMPIAVDMQGKSLGSDTVNFNVTIENKK